MDNPHNHVYNHMTAVENFHLVKRVMSVRPSIRNAAPPLYKHMNRGNSGKLRKPLQSSQE